MVDRFTPAVRSRVMSRVRHFNTDPELKVRSLVHRLGYRFRLHRHDLPGRPDIVLPRLHRAIFVHGCFWHGHECGTKPASKTRVEYWSAKIQKNRERDSSALRQLKKLGWRTLVVWECELVHAERLEKRIGRWLSRED